MPDRATYCIASVQSFRRDVAAANSLEPVTDGLAERGLASRSVRVPPAFGETGRRKRLQLHHGGDRRPTRKQTSLIGPRSGLASLIASMFRKDSPSDSREQSSTYEQSIQIANNDTVSP